MQTITTRTIALPGFTYDTALHHLHDAAGQPVALRPQTLATLHALAGHANEVVSKDDLMRVVWPGLVVTDDSLVQAVMDLRRALGDGRHDVVQTEPRRGYRLVSATDTAAAIDPTNPCHPTTRRDPPQPAHPLRIRFAVGAGGTRIAYTLAGKGPPLVRAAQWMTHLSLELQGAVAGPFLQRLIGRHRLLRYDGRGCGLSDRGVAAGVLDDEVRDLAAVVDDAGLRRFALLGHWQGAAIAVRYAALHPERVTRLVILGGQARGVLRRGRAQRETENARAFCKLLEEGWGDANSALRQLWTARAFPGATPEQQDDHNQMQRAACSPKDAATLHMMKSRHDATGALAAVRCPTLVLHNPDDALVPFEEGRLIASMIPGARLQTFTSRNHQPLPGEPAFEPVMAAIEAFVSGRFGKYRLESRS